MSAGSDQFTEFTSKFIATVLANSLRYLELVSDDSAKTSWENLVLWPTTEGEDGTVTDMTGQITRQQMRTNFGPVYESLIAGLGTTAYGTKPAVTARRQSDLALSMHQAYTLRYTSRCRAWAITQARRLIIGTRDFNVLLRAQENPTI